LRPFDADFQEVQAGRELVSFHPRVSSKTLPSFGFAANLAFFLGAVNIKISSVDCIGVEYQQGIMPKDFNKQRFLP
jgi:hypothetical protein